MCGRYHFGILDTATGQKILSQIKKDHLEGFKLGEVFPSDNCLCLIMTKDGLKLSIKKWGIQKKSLLINARKESLKEKASFQDLNRCAVIVNGFYEWKDKEKYYLSSKKDYMYLASLYDEHNDMVIITREADASMKGIHDRMPVIMDLREMLNYLGLKDEEPSYKELIIQCLSENISLF